MRLISLIAAASLALAGPGCTLIGATVGSAVTTPTHSTTPHHSTSRDTGALVGAMVGLAIDVATVATVVSVKHTLDRPYVNTCPTCD